MKKLINWCFDIYKKYKEIINYLICWVIATIINIGVFAGLNFLIGEELYQVSNVIAILASVFFQYFSNRFFVFERKKQTRKEVWIEFWKFMSARAVTALLDIGIMFVRCFIIINQWVNNEDIYKYCCNSFKLYF